MTAVPRQRGKHGRPPVSFAAEQEVDTRRADLLSEPPAPPDVVRDPDRLAALRETGLLDSEVEEEFDRLTRLATVLLRVPGALFSLVDEDRTFYKSCFGFGESLSRTREVTGLTFCHYSLVTHGALVIPDTRADPAYRKVPTVESMGTAAYLGVPVRAPGGEVLGSFCAIDFEPHEWSELEIETMKELAKSAEREVAIRHWVRRQTQLVNREREARLELEKMVESRARLIRGFTHDVKNPLGAADGYLDLLERGVPDALNEKQRERVARARHAIQSALGLIDDLIEIARAEAAQLEIRREAVDLRDLARSLVEEYRAQAIARHLELEFRCATTPPPLSSDPPRIRQILGNLLSNAIKYTPEGRVVVAVEVREDGEGIEPGEWVAVDVTDTGPGLSEAQQRLLFREFTRLDPSAADGAGLGLAISQRITREMGGKITVASEVGRGSTFTLWLPVRGG